MGHVKKGSRILLILNILAVFGGFRKSLRLETVAYVKEVPKSYAIVTVMVTVPAVLATVVMVMPKLLSEPPPGSTHSGKTASLKNISIALPVVTSCSHTRQL